MRLAAHFDFLLGPSHTLVAFGPDALSVLTGFFCPSASHLYWPCLRYSASCRAACCSSPFLAFPPGAAFWLFLRAGRCLPSTCSLGPPLFASPRRSSRCDAFLTPLLARHRPLSRPCAGIHFRVWSYFLAPSRRFREVAPPSLVSPRLPLIISRSLALLVPLCSPPGPPLRLILINGRFCLPIFSWSLTLPSAVPGPPVLSCRVSARAPILLAGVLHF